MCGWTTAVLATALLMSVPTPGQAASLQVAPVSIEVQAPSAAATLQLRNVGTTPLNAQIRVFRWVQVNGQEKLEPTDDVVVSPPITSLAPKTDYTVRLVRVAKQPVSRGENYRLLVDELPDPAAQRNRTVNLVLRYSIPVFFYSRDTTDAQLVWSIEQRSGHVYVSAVNNGDRHVRISDLKLQDGNGMTVPFGNGLTGYVLGNSVMRWEAPGKTHQLVASSSVAISAQGDRGPIHATPTAQPVR
jgi:fimbrial chaperone protein